MSHGSVCWSECVTNDVEATKAHYAAICGWTYTETPMDGFSYIVAMAGDAPVCGIMPQSALGDPEIPPHWMTYLEVADIGAAVEAAQRSGGTIIRPPFEVADVGTIAIVEEPGGSVAGLMQPV